MIYKIQYYNKLWKDWISFDQKTYKIREDAQKRIKEYREYKTGIKLRILGLSILK